MEALSCLLKRAREGGFLSGWQLSGKGGAGVEITHLLFADDTLVFCEPSLDQVSYLSCLPMWFEVMSGLKVNLDKNEITSVGRVENVEIWLLSLVARLAHSRRLTWVFFWVHVSRRWQFGTRLRKG